MTRCSSARTGWISSRTRSRDGPICVRPSRRRKEGAMAKQVALVIGAGDALGGAIARRFAKEGFVACVARRNGDKLTPLVESIRSGGGAAEAFGVDARKEEQMTELVERI